MLKEAWGLSEGGNVELEAVGLTRFRGTHSSVEAKVWMRNPPPSCCCSLLGFLLHRQKGSDCWYYSKRPHGSLVSQASSC